MKYYPSSVAYFMAVAAMNAPHIRLSGDKLMPITQRGAIAMLTLNSGEFEGQKTIIRIGEALAWEACGFPILEPSPMLAASLMATSLSGVDGLEMPWPTFFIRPPSGVLLIEQEPGVNVEPDAIIVRRTEDGRINALVVAMVHNGEAVLDAYHPATSLSELLAEPGDLSCAPDVTMGTDELSDVDNRTMRLVGRLIVGCILELATTPTPNRGALLRRPLKLSERVYGKRNKQLQPYVLGRDVRVDCRCAVSDYVRIGGSAPTVRSMVRGHWKRQFHGKGRSERKWIHVEPYWRGPDDGPVVIRSHVLGGKELE